MSKYTVHVPESLAKSRQMKTSSQWLAECIVHPRSQKSKVMLFRSPISVSVTVHDSVKPDSLVCRTASDLFALFQRLRLSGGVIHRLSWKGSRIGHKGLYELNHAIQTSAIRKGGLNIVRHWLETKRGSFVALACDFPALLSYLEIRPVPSTNSVLAPTTAIHYVYNANRHKVRKGTGKKRGSKPLPECKLAIK